MQAKLSTIPSNKTVQTELFVSHTNWYKPAINPFFFFIFILKQITEKLKVGNKKLINSFPKVESPYQQYL